MSDETRERHFGTRFSKNARTPSPESGAAAASPEDLEDGDEVINVIFDEKDSQTTTRSVV